MMKMLYTMCLKYLMFLCFVCCVSCVNYNIDYCSLCHNHTMCMYKGLGYKCGYTSTGGPLPEEEKKTIVDTHNRLRALVASGGETRGDPGPQPPASDMQQLEWDEELARTAQAWADQCDFGHDACRIDPRFAAGQNVFMSEGGVPWENAILSWYSEVEFFDHNIVDNFIFDAVTGHYAQMVWGNTRYIGCGKRTYPQKPRRYYKRDTRRVESLEPVNDREDQSENIRQTRKIGYNAFNDYNKNIKESKRYPSSVYDFSSFTQSPQEIAKENSYYKDITTKIIKNNYDFSGYTQDPKSYNENSENNKVNNKNYYDYSTSTSQKPQQTSQIPNESKNTYYNNYDSNDNYYQNYIDDEWRRYNATIQQYYEKYKNSIQDSDDLKKQLQFYKTYLDQMKQLTSPYLSYEQKSELFYDLRRKHEVLEKIHERLIYHDQKLKHKIANTKKLNPYIPKGYDFSTEKPVISGEVFEYYVCNYGPSGLYPGARMYTRGWNQCQYDGLCRDPLTVSYYPGLDRSNDPILSLLYEDNKWK